MENEGKIFDVVFDWIVNSGSSQYGSIYVVCDRKTAEVRSCELVQRYMEKHPDSIAICVSSEDYTRGLIKAIKDNALKDWQRVYNGADLLIMTGVEDIRSKAMTEKELYVTVDKMYEKHKQVVFFSSMLPRDIPGIEDRNRAQFEGSLIINLQKEWANELVAENPLFEEQILAFSRMGWTREMVNDWLEDMYSSR